jgi:Tol biopolymer transport system component
MDRQGGNAKQVLTLGAHESLGAVHWSPGRQRIGFQRDQSSASYNTSIESCDLKGENRIVAVPGEVGHWYNDFSWLADGRIIYARQESRESTNNNLWQRDIDSHSGKPLGEPKRLTRWTESETVGLSASTDGKLLTVLRQASQGQTEVGQLTAGGTRMGLPRRLSNDDAFGYPTDWTADSRAVFMNYEHNGHFEVFKQPIAEDAAGEPVAGSADANFPRLSPDGAWILYVLSQHEPPYVHARLMRLPVNGGAPEFVFETTNWIDHLCGRAPAGCVVVERSQDGKSRTVTAFDPFKGRGKLLRTVPEDNPNEYPAEAFSPDMSSYAVARNRWNDARIQLFSLSNGPDREIVVRGWTNFRGMSWAPGGKGLYCGSVSPLSRALLYVDLKGTAQVLRQYRGQGNGYFWGAPSPNGRYIAIAGGTLSANLWMLEGF